ncbi:spermine oxidase-like [Gigantopelta aegis]|uniref:spermine oxidase-like n=1 Tax=Gigantopelta aegis TaxID=1735272 RepID=UPI001B88E74D|nr:spermine oxidase-like [Gigantopelta aegis]
MAKTTANDIQEPSLTPRIVIIGAGIAGLSAARVLHQSGFHDVQVLEALDRVGGRINTVTCEKGIIDMGAQFIHGHKGNVIYDIAQANDLVLLPSDEYDSASSDSEGRERHPTGEEDSKGRLFASYSEQGLFFTSKGDNISRKLVQELMRVFDKISENGDLFYERYVEKRKMWKKEDGNMSLDGDPGSEESYLSYGEFIDKCFNEYMETCNDSPYMEQIKQAFNKYVFYLECIDNGCKSLYNLSLEGWGKFPDLEGSYDTEVKQGFSSVLNIYLNDIPADIIRLSKPVACVQWKHCGDALEAANDSSQSKNPTPDAVDVNPNKIEKGFNANQNTKAKQPKLDGGDASPNPRTEEQNSNTLGSKKLADGDAKLNPRFGKPRAVIWCDDGTSYEADHVIVTSSLGFLKSNHLTFFQPRLPATRQLVIEHAGFGTVNKVFLVWNQPFWSKDDGFTGYQFLWLDNIPVHVPSAKSQLKTSAGLNWYDNFVGFDTVRDHPNALLGWFCGEHAELMELVPEEEVRDVCTDLLTLFLNRHIPKPKQIIRQLVAYNLKLVETNQVSGSLSIVAPSGIELSPPVSAKTLITRGSTPSCSWHWYIMRTTNSSGQMWVVPEPRLTPRFTTSPNSKKWLKMEPLASLLQILFLMTTMMCHTSSSLMTRLAYGST